MLKISKMFILIFIFNLVQIIFASNDANSSVIENVNFTFEEQRLHKFLLFIESNPEIEEPIRMSRMMRDLYSLVDSQCEIELNQNIFEIAWLILKNYYCGKEQQMRKLFMQEKEQSRSIAIILADCFINQNMDPLLKLKAAGKIDEARHVEGTKFKYLMPKAIFLNKFLKIYKDLRYLEEELKSGRIISDEKSFIYIIKFLAQENPNFFKWPTQKEDLLYLNFLLGEIEGFCPENTTDHIIWAQNRKKQQLQDQAASEQLKKQQLEQERIELKAKQNAEKERQKKIRKFEQKVCKSYTQQKFYEWLQVLKNKKEAREKELKQPNQDHAKHIEDIRKQRAYISCDSSQKPDDVLLSKEQDFVDSVGTLAVLSEQKALIRQQRDMRRTGKNIESYTWLQEKSERYAIDWNKIQEAKDIRKGIIGYQESESENRSCFCHNGQWLGLYEESSSCIFCGHKSECK